MNTNNSSILNSTKTKGKPEAQLALAENSELKFIKRHSHGGMNLKKRRKVKRPLIPGAVTHVVLKSSKAKGDLSFYKHKKLVKSLLDEKSKKFFVQIKGFVNMGNHLHIKAKFKDRERFQQFLKSYTALLARKITGAKKGQPFGKFWDGLVYTRVLLTKFEELGLKAYFEGNHLQRELGYAERDRYLKRWNQYLYRLKATRAVKISTA